MNQERPNNLKFLRENRKISGTKIAEMLNISPQYYYDLEKGDRRLNETIILQLADFYNVSVDYLLGKSTESNAPETFVPSNIDLIRGKMTYRQLSADIGEKLENQVYEKLFDERYLKDITKGNIIPTRERILTLAKYAEVPEKFFYQNNRSFEDVLLAREEYKRQQNKQIDPKNAAQDFSHLGNDLYNFVADPKNLKYIEFALKKVKEKGINPDDIIQFILKC